MIRQRTARRRTALVSSLALMVPLAGMGFLLAGGRFGGQAQAQTAAKGATPGPSATEKEIGALTDALDDIDRLRSLTPLKLTPAQLDSLAATITTAQNGYHIRLTALSAPVLALADEIRATRRKALAGGAIPPEFDAKMIKIRDDYNKKTTDLQTQSLASLSAKLKTILSADQIDAAVKLTKEAFKKRGRELQGTDDQIFNRYVLDQFIGNAQLVPLLKEMRAAAQSVEGSNSGNQP